MKTKISKFINLNKKLFKKNNSKKAIAIVNRERFIPAVEGSIVASALANKKKLNIIIITDNVYKNIKDVFKSFGIFNFFTVSSFKNYILFFFYSLIALFGLAKSIFYILIFGFNNFILKFKFKKILVGDLIYDTYVRNDLSFINPKIDFKFLKISFFCYFKVLRLNNFLNKNNIKYLIVFTDCYAKNDAISIRIAWKKRIKVFQLQSSKKKIYFIELHKYEIQQGFMPIHKYFSKRNLDKLVPLGMKELESVLNKRFKGKINSTYTGQIDLKNANKINSEFSKELLIKKLFNYQKKFKKIILFAPHAFSDAPHHFGTFLFRDYWDQFVKTIDFFNNKKFRDVLWLIRPHPSSYMYYEENLIKNYIKNCNKNIRLCDSNLVSTKNLIKVCDTVITGRGTIGLEFACFKKKPILAGHATYSKFGLAIEPKTINEYFNSFSKSSVFEPLTDQQMLTARKILYYIENIYPKYMDEKLDKLIMSNKDKSLIGISSDKDKILSNKLLNALSRKSFENDLIYKFFYINGKYL